MFKVRSLGDMLLYATLITVLAVACTGGFVHLVTYRLLHPKAYAFAMLLAIGLPMVIAFPISLVALRIVRLVTGAVEKIEAFVKFDALTGVLARSYFMEAARQRFGEGGALMLVDADHFKRINDNFGHDVGDEALKAIGGTLSRTVPPEGLVGRIGGEEFAVFLPSFDRARAEALAKAICAEMRASGRVVADRQLGLTVSIGVAMIVPGSTLTLIFKQADERLYSAKASGRNTYVFAENGLGDSEPVDADIRVAG